MLHINSLKEFVDSLPKTRVPVHDPFLSLERRLCSNTVVEDSSILIYKVTRLNETSIKSKILVTGL